MQRQYTFLLFLISFCTLTLHVWAQQPSKNTPKTVQYTFKVIAKKAAKQTTVIDGLTIRSFDGSHSSSSAFLADSGDFIYYAYTNKGYALFKDQHALAYEGKSISGITDGKSEGNNLNFHIYAVSPQGDVLYKVQYNKPNDRYAYYYAIALNDSIVWDQSAQDQAFKTNHTPRLVVANFGKPGFTKDSKVAIPLVVEGSSERKWLIGNAIQDSPPDGADGDCAPITDKTSFVPLNKHTGINALSLFQQEFGTKHYFDDDDLGTAISQAIQCCAHQNAKGQIGMILNNNAFELFHSNDMFDIAQVVLLATPGAPDDGCSVTPLAPITDPVALRFEDGDNIDTDHLTPQMQASLAMFRQKISEAGGHVVVTSAYRPPAYQAHLREVYDKWLKLKDKHDLACQELRNQVKAEFLKHGLKNQRPASPAGPHTQGLAIDLGITKMGLPREMILEIAKECGLYLRTDLPHDPFHFQHL